MSKLYLSYLKAWTVSASEDFPFITHTDKRDAHDTVEKTQKDVNYLREAVLVYSFKVIRSSSSMIPC